MVICGRRLDALQATAAQHPAIRALACDVTDEASVQALFAQAHHMSIGDALQRHPHIASVIECERNGFLLKQIANRDDRFGKHVRRFFRHGIRHAA